MEQYSKIKTINGLLVSALLSGMLCLIVQIDSNGLAIRTEQAQEVLISNAESVVNLGEIGAAESVAFKITSEEQVLKLGSILWPY